MKTFYGKHQETILDIIVVGILAVVLLQSSEGQPLIGCEDTAYYLSCWNQGVISPMTYFDKATGFYQHANQPDRFQDVTYVYGYGHVTSGVPVVFGTNIIPTTLRNATDNLSYYWADSSYIQTQGNTNYILHKNHSQNLTSSVVTITFSFQADRRVTGNNFFFHILRNIDVGHDGIPDSVVIRYDNNTVQQYNMSNLGSISGNLSRLVIDGSPTGYQYEIEFFHNVSFWYNNTNNLTNGDWTLGEYIGTVQAGTVYHYSYEWIDAGCSLSCVSGCTLILQSNATITNLTQGQRYAGWFCRRAESGATCGIGGCIISGTGCPIVWQQNLSETYQNIPQVQPDLPLKCKNAACQSVDPPARLIWYGQDVIGSHIGVSSTQCKLTVGATVVTTNPQTEFTVFPGILNITLWNPKNGTVISEDWANLSANWTVIPPDNMTLWINNSPNMTISGALSNLTINRTFTCGIWPWDVRMCYSHNCGFSWNGNFTVIYNNTNCTPPIGGGAVVTPFLPKAKEAFQQFSPEDKTILGILGGVLFMGITVWLLKRRSEKDIEDVQKYHTEVRK